MVSAVCIKPWYSHLFIKRQELGCLWRGRMQKSPPAPRYSSFQIVDKRKPFISYQMRCALFLIERELKTKRREGKIEESPSLYAISKFNLDISYFEVWERVQRRPYLGWQRWTVLVWCYHALLWELAAWHWLKYSPHTPSIHQQGQRVRSSGGSWNESRWRGHQCATSDPQ